MYEGGRFVTAGPVDRPEPGPLGVRCLREDRMQWGYTLFSPAMDDTAYLIDPHGLVVRRWRVRHSQLQELLPDGRLVADDYGHGISILGPDGEETWRWEGPYHHDFAWVGEDRLAVLTHRTARAPEGLCDPPPPDGELLDDVVVALDKEGRVLWSVSVLEHIEEMLSLLGLDGPLRYAYRTGPGRVETVRIRDFAHTNTLEVLPPTPLGERDPRFRPGNLLLSLRALDTVLVLDPVKGNVTWAWGPGELDGQHQPTMRANGHILLFDNGTYRGYSRVIEIDPVSGEIVWKYEDKKNFFSPYRSGVQELENGNILICESDAGRIFEVTRDHEIVWDYVSPFIGQCDGHQGRHIYRATRYTEAYVLPVLASMPAPRQVADPEGRAVASFREAVQYYQRNLRRGARA